MRTHPKILIIPGLGGSGDKHWQTHWSKKIPNSLKLQQDNWDQPLLPLWLKKLRQTITILNCPVIIVAHSLGVSLIAHYCKNYTNLNIKAALLVAPADVDSPKHTPNKIRNFSPMPISKFPFPSTVVTSTNDPYINILRAEYFAKKWGSHFINIGAKGHINSDSDLNSWEEGLLILEKLIQKVE